MATVRWNPATGVVGIRDKNGVINTFFRPMDPAGKLPQRPPRCEWTVRRLRWTAG